MNANPIALATVRLSLKGQFCIPKRMREALGMRPGTRVEIRRVPDGLAIRIRRRSIVEETAGSLRRYIKPKGGASA